MNLRPETHLVALIVGVATFFVLGDGSSNESTPKSAVATVDTLASSSDTFNLAKPEATKLVTQPNNEIWYTSSDGKVVVPYKDVFGAVIESNTYNDGKGVLKFKGDVTTIGKDAFVCCTNLTSVTIPNSVTTIEEKAFGYCNSIKEFNGKFASKDRRCLIIDGKLVAFAPAGITEYTIPNSVTTIGDYAFRECSSLTSVTIPNSVTTIGERAFSHCKSLTSVTIPNSVTSIGDGAFGVCSSLKEFKGEFASPDGRCLIINGKLVTFAPVGIAEYTIPNSVTTIGDSAFLCCSSLTSITIPNSVTTIGGWAFCECESLNSVTIPNSVTAIGEWAFLGCESLTSVTIPNSVTTIGEYAFRNCYNLSKETKNKIKSINPNAL